MKHIIAGLPPAPYGCGAGPLPEPVPALAETDTAVSLPRLSPTQLGDAQRVMRQLQATLGESF